MAPEEPAGGGAKAPPEPLDSTVDRFERNRLGPVMFALLFVGSFVALLYTVQSFLIDLVLALILVGMSLPMYEGLLRRVGRHPWFASLLVTTALMVLVLAPLAFLIALLAEEATTAYEGAQHLLADEGGGIVEWGITNTQSLLGRFGVVLDEEQVRQRLIQMAGRAQAWVFERVGSLVNNLAALLIHTAVVLLSVFYLLVEGGEFKHFVFRLSPLPDEEEELLLQRFREVARGTLWSNGIGSVAQGVFGGLMMAGVGLPSPVLWGSVMAILAFLPLVGISVVVVPASLFLYLADEPGRALVFFAACTAMALITENIIKTRLIGAGARMHDLLVFLSVLGGIGMFGLFGLLLGPLIAAAFMTLTELYFAAYRSRFAENFSRRDSRRPPPRRASLPPSDPSLPG